MGPFIAAVAAIVLFGVAAATTVADKVSSAEPNRLYACPSGLDQDPNLVNDRLVLTCTSRDKLYDGYVVKIDADGNFSYPSVAVLSPQGYISVIKYEPGFRVLKILNRDQALSHICAKLLNPERPMKFHPVCAQF